MTRNIPYTLVDTAGQMTAVIDVPVTRDKQSILARPLMTKIKNIGQVCFIEKGQKYPRLQMMGNELSVNGCAAAVYYWLRKNQKQSGSFETSGDSLIIKAKLKTNDIFVSYPKRLITNISKKSVKMPGIRYWLKKGFVKEQITTFQKEKLQQLSQNCPASGIIYYEQNKIQPLIYVKATNTLVWETCCGSASIAYSRISGQTKILQPSGSFVSVEILPNQIKYMTEVTVLS